MPNTGIPSSNTFCGARGVSASATDAGPPERMIPTGRELLDKMGADVPRMNFAVHAAFTHAACNQLGILGAEVKNEYLLMHVSDTRNYH